MQLNLTGRPSDVPKIRAGFIGCGSHAFRNVYPTLQFAPVELVATCDLDADRASAFARQFGAERSYTDYRQMLEKEKLDAVFIVTNYDEHGRPRYGPMAMDCLRAGKHVWMEKPLCATVEEVDQLSAAAGELKVMVGYKKMFFPANEKAHQLTHAEEFGRITLASLRYPQQVPTVDDLKTYLDQKKKVQSAQDFLDHFCHPASLLIYLMGMPQTLFYQRTASGAGVATFGYADERAATLMFSHGAVHNGGMEQTVLLSDRRGQVIVDNNLRVTYHRDDRRRGYGASPTFYTAEPNEASAVWEPEFSLGQLYNKGLFLLGYYGEITEFAGAILERRPLAKAHLQHARQITQLFTAFAKGPGKLIELPIS